MSASSFRLPLMAITLFFALCLFCPLPTVAQQSMFSFFPPFYDPSLEPANPLPIAGEYFLITGPSRGQGNAIALRLISLGLQGYGISRSALSMPGLTYIRGDIDNDEDVARLVAVIARDGVKIKYQINNAGELNSVFDQDQNVDTLDIPYRINFRGNYRVYDAVRRAGLFASSGVRVGWTASVGAITYFGPIEAYDHAKAGIVDWVKRMAIDAYVNDLDIYHFAILPFGVATNISCNPYKLCIKKEVCAEVADALAPAHCPLPPADGSQTTPQDVAHFYSIVLSNPNTDATFFIIDSNVGLDANGGTYQSTWAYNWLTLSPKEYATAWKASVFPYFYLYNGAPAVCTAAPGKSVVPAPGNRRYCDC